MPCYGKYEALRGVKLGYEYKKIIWSYSYGWYQVLQVEGGWDVSTGSVQLVSVQREQHLDMCVMAVRNQLVQVTLLLSTSVLGTGCQRLLDLSYDRDSIGSYDTVARWKHRNNFAGQKFNNIHAIFSSCYLRRIGNSGCSSIITIVLYLAYLN